MSLCTLVAVSRDVAAKLITMTLISVSPNTGGIWIASKKVDEPCTKFIIPLLAARSHVS